jgi:hypothetical protein
MWKELLIELSFLEIKRERSIEFSLMVRTHKTPLYFLNQLHQLAVRKTLLIDFCEDFVNLCFGKFVSFAANFINVIVISIVDFAELAIFMGLSHSPLESWLALSLKVEVNPAHFLSAVVMQPLDLPPLDILVVSHYSTLLPVAVAV